MRQYLCSQIAIFPSSLFSLPVRPSHSVQHTVSWLLSNTLGVLIYLETHAQRCLQIPRPSQWIPSSHLSVSSVRARRVRLCHIWDGDKRGFLSQRYVLCGCLLDDGVSAQICDREENGTPFFHFWGSSSFQVKGRALWAFKRQRDTVLHALGYPA